MAIDRQPAGTAAEWRLETPTLMRVRSNGFGKLFKSRSVASFIMLSSCTGTSLHCLAPITMCPEALWKKQLAQLRSNNLRGHPAPVLPEQLSCETRPAEGRMQHCACSGVRARAT